MLYINKITSDPSQNINLTGIPNLNIAMTLRYLARMQLWVMGLKFGTTTINGIMVTTAPNMLRQFKNNMPFGIACLKADGLDPYYLTDFSTQAANLYLLNSDDVAVLEAEMFT